MSKAEARLVEAVPAQVDVDMAAKQLSPVLLRSPRALKAQIIAARERVIARGERVADILQESMEAALASGQPQVSGRLALEVLDRMSAEGERVFEPPQTTPSQGMQVLVGIKLGGVKDAASRAFATTSGELADSAPESPAILEG
jgi:hypothetical protein